MNKGEHLVHLNRTELSIYTVKQVSVLQRKLYLLHCTKPTWYPPKRYHKPFAKNSRGWGTACPIRCVCCVDNVIANVMYVESLAVCICERERINIYWWAQVRWQGTYSVHWHNLVRSSKMFGIPDVFHFFETIISPTFGDTRLRRRLAPSSAAAVDGERNWMGGSKKKS